MSEDRQCDLSLWSVHFTLCDADSAGPSARRESLHFRNHEGLAGDAMSIFHISIAAGLTGEVFPSAFPHHCLLT